MIHRYTLFLLTFLHFVLLTSTNLLAQNVLPVQLIYPSNHEVLVDKAPTFSWMNTSANAEKPLWQGFGYELKIVEILAEQSPEAAIVSNLDFYRGTSSMNIFTYPIVAPPLEKGKKYAWQVKYNYTIGEAAIPAFTLSEPYEFSIIDVMADICVPTLKEIPENKYYAIDDYKMTFEFDSTQVINKSMATYKIIDAMGSASSVAPISSINTKYSNINLKELAFFRKKATRDNFYTLEAILPDGRKFSLKFFCK